MTVFCPTGYERHHTMEAARQYVRNRIPGALLWPCNHCTGLHTTSTRPPAGWIRRSN